MMWYTRGVMFTFESHYRCIETCSVAECLMFMLIINSNFSVNFNSTCCIFNVCCKQVAIYLRDIYLLSYFYFVVFSQISKLNSILCHIWPIYTSAHCCVFELQILIRRLRNEQFRACQYTSLCWIFLKVSHIYSVENV